MEVSETTVKAILTRTGGFLRGVVSHSLQPYRGCSFGNALCGVGCYVQHNIYVTQGRRWGSFLEARINAAEIYRKQFVAEQRWARRRSGGFGIFCSSSTDPFVPQEERYRVTHSLLEAMLEQPPDRLILQTHSHRIVEYLPMIRDLAGRCSLRAHISIETDRDSLPGLPPHATPIERRFQAAEALTQAGIFTAITVAPLLPIENPERFFERIRSVADAVVLDHFIGGDGTSNGDRTRKTPLPTVMAATLPGSERLEYRDRMARVARRIMPGRVGVGSAGFAGHFE
jgi:DNA repair photolyase